MVRSTDNNEFDYHEYDDNDHLRQRAQEQRTKDLDTILGRFEREEHTLADTGNAAISGGEAVLGHAHVYDESNDSSAVFSLLGGANSVTLAHQAGSTTFAAGSKGTDSQVNVYWDTDQYEVENQTGGEITIELVLTRAV